MSNRSAGVLFSTWVPGILVAAVLVHAVGCGGGGPERFAVSGQVTWHGQPVPAGTITFTPSVLKGGSGPQGAASIRAGHYDTHDNGGRGAVGGPQIITVSGFDGGPPEEMMPLGKRLFSPYQIERILPRHDTVLDLHLPETDAK